ncbi:MAG: argininosuccinate lyase [Hyphomicrobiaceae bacterium]|nr:argininosuccinate lyase [Hyphomicrobiaceae bacterium]
MWGGRFSRSPSELMERFNASVDYDQRLAEHDIRASMAHASMLADTEIISMSDAEALLDGLQTVLTEVRNGSFNWKISLEDVHMNIENRLRELIGPVAGRLHTARSRNDQVATDFRLYIRDTIDQFDHMLAELQFAFARKAEMHYDLIMPGFTHLQPAQPITFGHHLMAYVEMLARDRGRFLDAKQRLNECPLGAAALAGTSFPINRDKTSLALGFSRPTANSLDSVSDRDFVLETLSVATICSTHLSRFAEEMVIWTTPQFGFLNLSDAWTTGSSIMPQKRNPDAAELVRAKVGRIAGAFQSLILVMKALPLAYSKDMQEDKEVTFDALDNFATSLGAMVGMVDNMEPVPERMISAAGCGFSTATDLADWLVKELKLPFRDAHNITGQIIVLAESRGCDIKDLSLPELRDIAPCIPENIFSVLSVENSVNSKTSYGGTAPHHVREMAQNWIARLENRT